MATKGKTAKAKARKSATPELVKCELCGKLLKGSAVREKGMGHVCETLLSNGYTAEVLANHYQKVTLPAVPTGWVKVADVGRFIEAHPAYGCSVSRFVSAMGKDRAIGEPDHRITRPVYVGRTRYVHPWLITEAGLRAMGTKDYKDAPRFVHPLDALSQSKGKSAPKSKGKSKSAKSAPAPVADPVADPVEVPVAEVAPSDN
jgi:hypothetical protein